jgi:ABC-type Na+ efflux pump permease subunit
MKDEKQNQQEQAAGMGLRVRRVWTLALATTTQLVRMKMLAFLVLFCMLVVGAGFMFSVVNPEQQLSLIKSVSLGALQVFSIVIGIVSTALLLPKDMEDRTLYTILSKPVPRLEYLIGKLLGVLLLVGGGLIVMDAVLSAVIYARQDAVLAEALHALEMDRQATPEVVARLEQTVAAQGLTWNMHWAVWAIFLKATVVTTMALLLSCIASSTLFTIVVSFCAVIIGHGEALLREFFFHPHLSGTAERGASMVLAMVVPDLAQFDILDGVVEGQMVSWGALADMTGIAALYVVGYLTITYLVFVEKEL